MIKLARPSFWTCAMMAGEPLSIVRAVVSSSSFFIQYLSFVVLVGGVHLSWFNFRSILICLIGALRRFAEKFRAAPDGHPRVENYRRPQGDSDRLPRDAGSPEDDNRAEIIHHHRADQPSGGATLGI